MKLRSAFGHELGQVELTERLNYARGERIGRFGRRSRWCGKGVTQEDRCLVVWELRLREIDDVEALDAVWKGLSVLLQCGKSSGIGKPGRGLGMPLLRGGLLGLPEKASKRLTASPINDAQICSLCG